MTSSAYRASQTFCIFQNPLQAEVQRALALRSQELIFLHQFHLQPIHTAIETSCLVSLSRTKRFVQTTFHFLKAPNAPANNKVDTNRYIFSLPEKLLHLHGIFWSEPIPSSKISESKIPASLMHPPQIRES